VVVQSIGADLGGRNDSLRYNFSAIFLENREVSAGSSAV